MMQLTHVLVICAGNICRSPLAAALLARDLPGVTVSSAGLTPVTGSDVEPTARRVAEAGGLVLPPHRARALNGDLVAQNGLFLVMDAEQRQAVLRRYPQTANRIWHLGQWTRPEGIPDPYGKSEEFHSEVYRLLVAAAGAWVKRLRPE